MEIKIKNLEVQTCIEKKNQTHSPSEPLSEHIIRTRRLTGIQISYGYYLVEAWS